jgi:GTP-binding protein Era
MKSGFVGLLGLPNAGKSSLFNSLIEAPLSIVTSKAQTTRKRLHGIVNLDEAQLVFVDSPGLVTGKKKLDLFLMQEFYQIYRESDVLMWVVSPQEEAGEETESSYLEMKQKMQQSTKPWFLVFNKADLPQNAIFQKELIDSFKDQSSFKGFFSVSNLKPYRPYLREILLKISEQLPVSEQKLYSEDDLTLQSLRDLACEYVRESCFQYLKEEVPYLLTTQVRNYQEQPSLHKIWMDVVVGKKNHLPIVVGNQASMIKKIGERSRTKIEKLVGSKVFLQLNVKVDEKWTENTQSLKEYGYELTNQ